MAKRKGYTRITSVSLSKEFAQLCSKYHISPTNAIRKGIAIELFERGVPLYQTQRNLSRYTGIQAQLATLDDQEQIKKEALAMRKQIETVIVNLQKSLNRIPAPVEMKGG